MKKVGDLRPGDYLIRRSMLKKEFSLIRVASISHSSHGVTAYVELEDSTVVHLPVCIKAFSWDCIEYQVNVIPALEEFWKRYITNKRNDNPIETYRLANVLMKLEEEYEEKIENLSEIW